MKRINLSTGGHIWEKQNLVTIISGRTAYDILKCSSCGITGKSIALGTIDIPEKYSSQLIIHCSGFVAPKRIKISFCTANGPQFKNLTPDSEHVVIEPPGQYKNDGRGVWVMGVGEPVKVLSNEYTAI